VVTNKGQKAIISNIKKKIGKKKSMNQAGEKLG
jgi:hypothetical protein